MATRANLATYADHWFKPFGKQSEGRERAIILANEAQEVFKRDTTFGAAVHKMHQTAQQNFWKPADTERVKPKFRQPVVKVKSYAHDRIVLSTFIQAPDIRKGLTAHLKFREAIRRSQFLVSRREFQASFNVLGRERFKPARTSFTTYAKNMTRDLVHMLELFGEGQCVFATTTLPGSESEGFEVVGAASGDICNLLNTWLRDHVSGGDYVYVWEMQERGAPHMHYMFRLPDGTKLADFSEAFQREWRKILLSISETSGVDLFRRDAHWTWKTDTDFPRCDVRPVTHTFERYISKYISKSRSKGGIEHTVYPRRWWGCSNGLRNLVKKFRSEHEVPVDNCNLGFAAIQQLVNTLGDTVDGVMYFERIKGCGEDSVSIRVPHGHGFKLARAILAYFEDGDLLLLEIALLEAREHADERPQREVP